MKPLDRVDLDHILLHTKPIWNAVRGKSIFISGGTGFFGAWLLESLAHCNRELDLNLSATVLSRDPAAFLNKMPHLSGELSIRMLQGDVRSFSFPEEDFDYVIHGAAPTTAVTPGHHFDLLSTLLDGTRRMLALAQTRGTKRFLFVSSGAVYGRQPENLSHIPEDYLGGPDWLNLASTYAEGKRVCEQLCSLTAQESGIEFGIARCFAFVGPHLPLDQHFAIGNFIRDALAGKNIAIQGDGTPMRSYLYAADLVIWLWTMLLADCQPKAQPLVLNVGSGEAISILDLAREVVNALAPTLSIEIARAVSGGPVLRYVPDVQKAEAILNLRETIGLRDAIRRTAAWHR
ncbi:MAG: NAD-dependent epimerase/dehydratase family protein [Terracidiphilus sp.]